MTKRDDIDAFLESTNLHTDIPAGVGFTVREVMARGYTEAATRTEIERMVKAGKAKLIGLRKTAKVYQMVK